MAMKMVFIYRTPDPLRIPSVSPSDLHFQRHFTYPTIILLGPGTYHVTIDPVTSIPAKTYPLSILRYNIHCIDMAMQGNTIALQRDNNDCELQHVINWLSLFVDMHNREIMEKVVK